MRGRGTEEDGRSAGLAETGQSGSILHSYRNSRVSGGHDVVIDLRRDIESLAHNVHGVKWRNLSDPAVELCHDAQVCGECRDGCEHALEMRWRPTRIMSPHSSSTDDFIKLSGFLLPKKPNRQQCSAQRISALRDSNITWMARLVSFQSGARRVGEALVQGEVP